MPIDCKAKPGRKKPPALPVPTAVERWISTLPTPDVTGGCESLLSRAPRRYVVYEPMALLPSGSFGSPQWTGFLEAVGASSRTRLWQTILAEISARTGGTLTHLAVNDGIPAHLDAAGAGQEEEVENVLRSPVGLRMLHGDFGPAVVGGGGVTASDFEAAFWVSTRQNGIIQTWAPRWTMFSRGNFKEKERLLRFRDEEQRRGESNNASTTLTPPWAVDPYAGIGYFVFSYARLGMRVLCWELNPWSVEGLRRGALANGWPVRVVGGGGAGAEGEEGWMEGVLAGGEQIVVFWEDNRQAGERLGHLGRDRRRRIVRVNCGFLPSSEKTWRMALDVTRDSRRAWLHLHENVGAGEEVRRGEEIQRMLSEWEAMDGRGGGGGGGVCGGGGSGGVAGGGGRSGGGGGTGRRRRTIAVEHVERVKTFAPGVWHCVFDVLCRSEGPGQAVDGRGEGKEKPEVGPT